jgi:hypothetical protein
VGASYSWTFNGNPIVGANTYNYSITEQGIYCVTITFPGGCQQTDCMVVDYISPIVIGTPNDLFECAAPFNLTDNSSVILNGTSNPISFYHSLADAQQLESPILNPTNYNGTDGETIFVAVENNNNDCIVTTQFVLQIEPTLCSTNPNPNGQGSTCSDNNGNSPNLTVEAPYRASI